MQALRSIPGDLKVPMLLMQSGQDAMVDPEATRKWAAAAPSDKIEFVLWPWLYHEMLNEPEKAEVLARVHTWLDKQLL